MSFSGGSPIDNETARSKLAESEANADRYSRLHGGDDMGPPVAGPIRRNFQRLRSKLSRRHSG